MPEVLSPEADPKYKYTALFLSTLGMLIAMIDGSITLIALPDTFRGIGLDPLEASNSFYLLWMILGFMIVTAVLVTSFGRIGDIYGRVKVYNLGFALFTLFSALLSVTFWHGDAAGMWIVILRIFQGVGAAMLIGNSAAILADAFPPEKRGFAIGINGAAGLSGSFIGLVLGGVLAPIDWRLIFLVNVPIGIFATVHGYRKLREQGERHAAHIDWWGNMTFTIGLVLIMIGMTYGIEPYGDSNVGWASPWVVGELSLGVAFLILFAWIETRVPDPMFRLNLFRIRAFTAGSIAALLAAMARGGIQFMLIIWLQGIWLPEHGYSFERTPLWAGIFMVPLTIGFLCAGPTAGILSDRFGARIFASGGMIGCAVCFALLEVLPIDFPYWVFAILIFFTGAAMSCFGSPNRAAVMNSLPARDRGAGGGMVSTFQNTGSVLAIGVFFSLMIAGLSTALGSSLRDGLTAHGISASEAARIAELPPVTTLFAAFLGYNPIENLVGADVLAQLPASDREVLVGREFFPSLISGPFQTGLHWALDFMIIVSVIAAVASWTRGKHIPHETLAARPLDDAAEAVA